MSEDSSQPTPTATWNLARGVWETRAVSLFCGHSELYSATWPPSGSMRNGRFFARPISAPLTNGNAFSSSPGLPTPRARDSRGRGYEDALPNVVQLLPTPVASEATGGQHAPGKQGGKSLRATLLPTPVASDGDRESLTYSRGNPTLKGALLPTPRASDGAHGGPNQRGSKGDLALPAAVVQLLPTPRVTATRTGRSAILQSSSSPSLDQAIELVQGVLPRELLSLCEAPPSWGGACTSPPSDAGSTSSDAPRPQQLTIETG